MRATLLVSLAVVALPLTAQTPPSAKRTIELTGLVLVNGFFTNARVNNSDVPQFVDSLAPASAVGGTMRQTRLGVLVTEPDVLRGSFSGEVDVDFYGGQQPSSGRCDRPRTAAGRRKSRHRPHLRSCHAAHPARSRERRAASGAWCRRPRSRARANRRTAAHRCC